MSDVRLIDASRLEEAFAKECTTECPICSYYNDDAEVDVECHCKLITNAPTIAKCGRTSDGFPFMDLRPKPIGKWIKTDNRWNTGLWRCSYCDSFYDVKTNYCPTCGAKMKGEEE